MFKGMLISNRNNFECQDIYLGIHIEMIKPLKAAEK